MNAIAPPKAGAEVPAPGAAVRASAAPWEIVPAALTLVVIAAVSLHALAIEHSYDIGLAYQGGRTAWETGQPESLPTWISTPFLAMVMALVSRLASEEATSVALTIVNLLLLWGTIAVTWAQLRPRVPRPLWWATLVAAVGFAPAISSVWWMQLNIVALVLAIASFVLARRNRPGWAGLLAALSVATKPIVVVLPVFLLIGRQTRRAGLMTVAWAVGLLVAAQAFLAVRAGSLSALSPLPALRNFSDKSLPANIWVCHNENFSPQSTLCRLVGSQHWTAQRILVLGAVLLVVALVLDSLWHLRSDDWAWFAAACMLSPMLSPIAWSHYQLLLAPMLVLLTLRFWQRRERPVLWAWLLVGFGLTLLVWQPSGSAPGAIRRVLGGPVETVPELFGVFSVAMLAQYAVLLTALLHFRGADRPSVEGERTQVW